MQSLQLLITCVLASLLLPPGVVAASEPAALKAAPGFTAEEIFTGREGDGSWSAMTVDPRGRLIISPQGDEPMLRVTLSNDGSAPRVEKLAVPVTAAMGLLFAFDSFYVNGMGPQGFGLYRLRETKDADAFGEAKLLRAFEGEVSKEHGSHGLVLGPDNKIYLAQGNHVAPPADAAPTSPYQHYAEDQLLPSANYGVSGGDKAQAPGGHVLRMDADAREVEVFAGGLRNAYDLAFDARGHLFTFDSDTEANWGLPWYVPTRILHIVAGGDYGFREGTGKLPDYDADILPAVVDVGLGCPTGVVFGTASRFPTKYQRALFALDWTLGRILAVHLDQHGARFSGSVETLVQGRPLNVTDIEFGHDGAMYFITGGRKTRSALYRVRYTGGAPESDPPAAKSDHGTEDRLVSHAARIALEAQPVQEWRARAVAEKVPQIALTSLLALARVGTNADRAVVLKRAAELWPQLQSEQAKLDCLRIAAIALSRHGTPYPATQDDLLHVLDAAYPSQSRRLNRELSQILIALDAPLIVPRTLSLIGQAATFEDQLHYVFHLRHQRSGWSAAERGAYMRWFITPHPGESHSPGMQHWFEAVHLRYADGGSYSAYLTNIRAEAAQTLSAAERTQWSALIEAPIPPARTPVEVKPHVWVKERTMQDLLKLAATLKGQSSAAAGRKAFAAAMCVACHRYANEGGGIGPDLTTVAYKLGARELIESICEPSKVISDLYQSTMVELTNGETHSGMLVKKGRDKGMVSIINLAGTREDYPKDQVRSVKPSPISLMPPGLLNSLSDDEVIDLFTYLGYGPP